jgi:hypothetical protein
MNPHEILGVQEGIEADSLKRRYKILSKMFHPDRHQNDKSAVFFFQLIKKSYDSILLSREEIVIPEVIISKSEMQSSKQKTKKEDTKKAERQEKQERQERQEHRNEKIIPGTNITQNDIRVLSEKMHDPWFQPEFSLTEFFGDVSLPKKKDKNMRPKSTR